MDQSFDQFGGGGWGEHGDGDQQYENSSILQPLHQKSVYDKVPVQVEIDDLLKMSPDEEHFMIGKYKFNTIRIIGKIVNIHTDPNQSTSTYEVCDPLAPDPRTARRLTVIVINQEDNSRVVSNKAYLTEGQIIHIMGKARPYNNRMSLLSIHIRDIDMDEIELFKMECKLAKHYYQKNLPDLPAQALENTIFKILPTPKEQQQTRPGTGMSANRPTSMTPSTRSGYGGGGGGGYSNAPPTTPVRSNSSASAMQLQHHPAQSSNSYGLTLQQKRIYDFILRFAESNSGGSGVHVEQIRAHVRPNNEFNDDLQFLQNDGKIYTTVDDDHYAIVE